MPEQAHVPVILLSTYNGAAFLDDQLDSFARQSVPCRVIARDDGSSDTSSHAVRRWSDRLDITLTSGSNLGPAKSYLKLMQSAPPSDWYAFADQDDVWDPDKLAVAITRLSAASPGEPALYFSATRTVDSDLAAIGQSRPCERRALTFPSSLVRNVASGCTMVFNRHLLDLVVANPYPSMMMHDSWIYKVCLAVGGRVEYDAVPHISYRQHSRNVIGAQAGLSSRISRWMHSTPVRRHEAVAILERYHDIMPDTNIDAAKLIATYPGNSRAKLRIIAERQFASGDLSSRAALMLAILLERL